MRKLFFWWVSMPIFQLQMRLQFAKWAIANRQAINDGHLKAEFRWHGWRWIKEETWV